MVIDWSQSSDDSEDSVSDQIPAAEYVRMSTEHQKYSADNQSEEIYRYAERRGYKIIQRYADEGKSGLNIGGRKALQQLLTDIETGQAKYKALIVYDVSRWGRFQDVDEAASYELRCRHAGVAVHYCAEQFENDGSIGSSIIKTVKRAMAGEYSRELSVKVFKGQANLIRLGYRQGGAAGYGLRRMLVDQDGNQKNELQRGEHKSIATDRVILVPGPEKEIEMVREVFRRFVDDGMAEREIAGWLNLQGILTDRDVEWSRNTVHQLLINEKYIGNNVWGKTSFKLKDKHIENTPDEWIRADNVFPSIVDIQMYERARAIIVSRSEKMSDEEMLASLKSVLDRRGILSGLIIDEVDDCPSSVAFKSRFGGLLRAYTLVGFQPDHDYSYLETNRSLRLLHSPIVREVTSGLEQAGGRVDRDEETDLLRVNREFSISVCMMRYLSTKAGTSRWKLKFDTCLSPDITVAVRMNADNQSVKDYYILPLLDMREAVLRLAEYNGLSFDAYRTDSLEGLFALAKRNNLRYAA